MSVVGKLPDQEIVDTSLNLLVNGKFDLEGSFIIASGDALLAVLHFIRQIDSILQAQEHYFSDNLLQILLQKP